MKCAQTSTLFLYPANIFYKYPPQRYKELFLYNKPITYIYIGVNVHLVEHTNRYIDRSIPTT